jgi:hypothetical protein
MDTTAPPLSARQALACVQRWAVSAATPGSAGSLVFAAVLGAAAFAAALAAAPLGPPAAKAAAPAAIRPHLPLTDVSTAQPAADDPAALELLPATGAPPPPAIDTALDFEVVFYWPATPQTVSEPTAIREGPAPWARVVRSARPGERLRINGRVDAAPQGPWYRVRLADGRDGYFAAHTVDSASFRRRREPTQVAEAMAPVGDAVGAPLMPTPPPEDGGPEMDVIGPPAF